MAHQRQDSSSSVDEFIEEIVECLQTEQWDRAMTLLLNETKNRLSLPESFRRLGGIAMAAACYKESVPLEFFQVVVQATGKESATYQDAGLRTPLSMVLMYLDRPDIVHFLLEKAPSTLDMYDQVGLRPIDILTQKILMKEERMRYLKKAAHQQVDKEVIRTEAKLLEDCWECARLLCLTHGGQLPSHPNLPLLHACCLDHRHIPLSLAQRALRRFKDQLDLQEDVDGNTPLHIVASRMRSSPPLLNPDGGDDDYEDDLLEEIYKACPKAATVLNHYSYYPLNLAIAAGRKWSTGCRILVQAFPPALVHDPLNSDARRSRNTNSNNYGRKRLLYYLLTQRKSDDSDKVYDVVFQLLRLQPDLVLGATSIR